MDRTLVVELLKNRVIRYPAGKCKLWVSRCFEITVRTNQVVEVNEYEGYAEEDGNGSKRLGKPQTPERMYHLGRSIIFPKYGKVLEERGNGWTKLKRNSP